MRKGKITINKKGNAKIKPDDSKEISVPREFVFTQYTPTSGKAKYACEFEGNPIERIVIEGKEVPIDEAIAEIKKEEKAEKAQRKEEEAQRQRDDREKAKARKAGTWRNDSFNTEESCLPADTQVLLEDSDNFHLKLNKVPRYINDKFHFYKGDFEIKPNFGKFNFAQNAHNHHQLAQQIALKTVTKNFKVDWRLVHGLGHHSVYETSITLHHIYGIPYLPASSIKGVVRSWIILSHYFDKLDLQNKTQQKAAEAAEKLALSDQFFCDVFGCGDDGFYKKAHQGRVIFFDAFPQNEPNLEVDVMTPHYAEYYKEGSKIPPTDDQDPVPIPFLTIKATTFQFIIGVKDPAYQHLLPKVEGWLNEVLTQRGIGAKTATGYGFMNAVNA